MYWARKPSVISTCVRSKNTSSLFPLTHTYKNTSSLFPLTHTYLWRHNLTHHKHEFTSSSLKFSLLWAKYLFPSGVFWSQISARKALLFPQSLLWMPRCYLQLDHNSFLLYHFPFIIHESPCQSTLYCLSCWKRCLNNKWTQLHCVFISLSQLCSFRMFHSVGSGTAYLSHLQVSDKLSRNVDTPKHPTLYNIQEEPRPQLHCGVKFEM